MSLIYDLAEQGVSGLCAIQAMQRDWSPYLVHFTSRDAMRACQKVIKGHDGYCATSFKLVLDEADEKSYEVFDQILASGKLLKSPLAKKGNPPKCVCLSECSLPGAFNHSSRYGRFGLVFKKMDVYVGGGRPCVYLDEDIHWEINKCHNDKNNVIANKLWGLTNIYRPVENNRSHQEKPQDFTVEREWRTMDDLPIYKMCGVLCPYKFFWQVSRAVEKAVSLKKMQKEVPILPIDVLYHWGV